MLGHEVSGTFEAGAFDPACREPERVEFLAQYIANLANPSEVERSTIDVHQSLEQRERFGIVLVDVARNRPFDRCEPGRSLGRDCRGCAEKRDVRGAAQMSS
jgi:hypothetical protein